MNPANRRISLLGKTKIAKITWGDPHSRMVAGAAAAFGCSLLYALYNGVLGLVQASPWYSVLCAFYAILAAMRFSAVFCRRQNGLDGAAQAEYFMMLLSGILLTGWSFVLAAANYISLSHNIAVRYDKIVLLSIATYTFYKLILAVIRAARGGNRSVLASAVRRIGYAEAAASVLSLQRSMLVSFGSMEGEQICWMNGMTGAAVCLFIWLLGIETIAKSCQERERKNGKV